MTKKDANIIKWRHAPQLSNLPQNMITQPHKFSDKFSTVRIVKIQKAEKGVFPVTASHSVERETEWLTQQYEADVKPQILFADLCKGNAKLKCA